MLIAILEAPGLKKTLGKVTEQLQNKLPLFKPRVRAFDPASIAAANGGTARIGGGPSRCLHPKKRLKSFSSRPRPKALTSSMATSPRSWASIRLPSVRQYSSWIG